MISENIREGDRFAIHSGHDSATDTVWHILHTKSRREKALAAALSAMGVPNFLPLVSTLTYRGRHKVIAELPLFPGYVFLQGTVEQAYRADRTRHVASIIKVTDQARLERELHAIRLALSNNAPLTPYPFLKVGIWVEVTAGPFRGIRGIIEQMSKRARLILQIESLGQASCLEIDGSFVEPVDHVSTHRPEPARYQAAVA